MSATDEDTSNDIRKHLHTLIYDQKHMSARGLHSLSEKTGLDEYNLAVVICCGTAVYLVAGNAAQTFANAILTVTPILLTFVYPAEKPPTPQLLIYWGVFGLLTLLDPAFEPRSGYYLVKVLLLTLLFLHPFDGADRIFWHIRLAHSDMANDEQAVTPFTKEEISAMEQKSKGKRSPPPEAPEGMKSGTAGPPGSGAVPGGVAQPTGADQTGSATQPETSAISDAGSYRSTPSSYGSSEDGVHPMLRDPRFRTGDQLPMGGEGLSTNYNPHDLDFEPTQNLVFNAPFDFGSVTYLMRICNTSTKFIAFAIKSNAIPRVLASPPCGILPPKHKLNISVTIQKIERFNENLVKKDRLAFDYVFCPPETKKFSFQLLRTEMRRRKNVFIKYNP